MRGVGGEQGTALASAIEAALEGHPAVSWAAVNATLGVVVIACDDNTATGDLTSIVAQVERDYSLAPEPPASRPPAVDRVPGALAAVVADVAGLAIAGAGVALHTTRLPAELGSLVQFVDTQPRLRSAVERAVGTESANLVLAAGNAVAQSAAQGTGGLALDIGQRVAQLAEAVLERNSFARAEPALCGDRHKASANHVSPERPQPIPDGPVERHSERIGLGAVGAFGGILAATRNPQRAAGVALAGLPKAARLGREGFAAALGCLLARRGIVVRDHKALRRLDRIDTIVIDADVLTSGGVVVGEVVPVDDADADDLTGVAHTLFDPERISDVRTDGPFALGPLDALGLLTEAGAELATRLTDDGAAHVLGLAEDHRLLAVVSVIPQPAPAADLILTAARRCEATFLLAAPDSGSSRPASDAAEGYQYPVAGGGVRVGEACPLPGGRRLAASIQGLQAGGAGVMLVSRQRRALTAADCGIGLTSADGKPAWGAHVVADADLTAAAPLIDAIGIAKAASHRGVRLSQAGATLGTVLAFGGTAPGAARRSLLAVNGAGAIALAAGAWSVTGLARHRATPPLPGPPWHAMPTDLVLDRLKSMPGGLSSDKARARWHPDERQPQEPSLSRAFLAELANPLTPILAGGAALSASIGAVADAIIVSGVCALSSLMGAAQRVYTERSMAQLAQTSAVTACVIREGDEHSIPAAELVAGDVVTLGGGDVVPADCRLLVAESLQADESSLTGESIPVDKSTAPVTAEAIADRRCMLYEGTTIAAGRAVAVVVATGAATEMGRSHAALAEAAPITGVEARLAQITGVTLPLAVGSAGAVVAAGLLRGRPARDTIGAAVGLAVASVPEGLPFLVTAAQLASARRLAGRGALVRNPRTIEALGRVDVLC
ncbi:MAG: HAD-IC family P-type ATPase, partial [Actinobacteria bacterium]|nr:HAD-IC family P-type ATPase [Actinomycetota bacterium]